VVSKSFQTESINEINNNNKESLRSNTKCSGGRTHKTDSQNSDTTALSGRELYRLQFSLQVASPETFGYTLVFETYLSCHFDAVHDLDAAMCGKGKGKVIPVLN
jgi:hypothetical protein